MLDVDFVVTVHDEIISTVGGLAGFAGGGLAGVEAALKRVEFHGLYAGLDDALGIAAMYAEAIAKGHVFNDANKRTGLTCALTYLSRQGIRIRKEKLPEDVNQLLEDATVAFAEGTLGRDDFAFLLGLLADLDGKLTEPEM